MMISLFLITVFSYSNVQAQSISGQRSRVERLVDDVKEQQDSITSHRERVEKVQKKVDDKIEKDKEAAKENPKDHGTNIELDELREKLKKEQAELEKEEKKLKRLQEKLKKAQEKLEKKLNKAVDDIIKKNPIPDDPDELDNYEDEMKKLETNPRNSKTEAELRKRIQERIDAKRKEMEEHGALPGSQNQGFPGNDSNWRRINNDSQPISAEWSIGGHYTAWFSQGEKYPDTYFEDIKKEIYSNPELTEKLMEKLGGEFHIGSFSAPGSFTNYQNKKPQFFGINGAYWMNDHFGLEAGLAKGHSSTSAEFPVTTFKLSEGSTDLLMGKLKNSKNIYAAHIYVQYRLIVGIMRIIAGAGLDYQHITASDIEAILGGEQFTIKTVGAQSTISPRVQLGMQLKVSNKIYLEAKANTRLSEKKLELGAQLALQYRLVK